MPFETEVKYRLAGSKGEGLETARSSNISPEGLCLRFKEPVEKGTLLHIEITLQELPAFSIKGEVVWANTKGNDTTAGIKILDIDKNEKNRFLLELCDKMVNELGQKYPHIKI